MMRVSVSVSESARLSVLYTKRMKQTYEDGMSKIQKENKGSKKTSTIVHSIRKLEN